LRLKQLSFAALMALIVMVNAIAQKALPKKPFDQWSPDEVTQILFNC